MKIVIGIVVGIVVIIAALVAVVNKSMGAYCDSEDDVNRR